MFKICIISFKKSILGVGGWQANNAWGFGLIIALLTTKLVFLLANLCVDEERGKKPLAIARFDERRIKLIYFGFTFHLHRIAGIY